MRLEGKVALVTGGSRGIGRATAKLFAREGANVYICGRREEPLIEVAETIGCSYETCDITEQVEVEDLVRRVVQRYDKIDVLVNNAGVFPSGSISSLDWHLNQALGTNVKGTLLVSRYVMQEMIKHKSGSIVNVSSILGVLGAKEVLAYTASKAAIIGSTRALAADLAEYGIRVNCVSPTITRTDMVADYLLTEPGRVQQFIEMHPLGRIAEPEDIAKAILFFASDDSNFVTGQNLVVDGGRSAVG
jgi:meso-butanediol dehydrogenase / (S,S)-butanediol dehydrogenase / diacetyl reductase